MAFTSRETMNARVQKTIDEVIEAVIWCESRPKPWDPKHSFRSSELDPGTIGPRSAIHDVREVKVVQNKRRKLLRESAPPEIERHGDLLVYDPGDSLAMGIGEEVSQGFLEGDNIPPWDTWISLLVRRPLYDYLLSWVPGAFVGLVDEAIKANPDESIFWWDRWHGAFRDLAEEVVQEVHRQYPSIRIGRTAGADG